MGSSGRLMLRGARQRAADLRQFRRQNGTTTRGIGEPKTYVCYRRHGKLEGQRGDDIGEVLLLLLREELILLVRRAAVPRHEGIHAVLCF